MYVYKNLNTLKHVESRAKVPFVADFKHDLQDQKVFK